MNSPRNIFARSSNRFICGPLPIVLVLLVLTLSVRVLATPGKSTKTSENARTAVEHLQARPAPTPIPTPTPKKFNFEPSEVSRNSTHTLKITSNDCTTNKFEALDKVITASEIEDYKSKGIEITPKTLETPERCIFTALLTVTDAAAFHDLSIALHYKVGAEDHADTITITMVKEEALPPGPIPPGLKPAVDIMWAVVPQKIVKDNFGRRVGQNFYCIEVVIGNNTGYELQIASVGFELGPVGDAAKYIKQRLSQATTEISNSAAISEAIAAEDVAAIKASQALKDAAEAEIQKLNMEVAPPKQKEQETHKYEKATIQAERSKGEAEQSEKIAREKQTRAFALVKARVELVQSQADYLTQLSHVAYAQKLPVGSYMMTRGSLQHGQIWSPRNFTLNGLKAFGPFLTGFTPFFHVLNHRANFSEGINIISNPLEKGFEAVMPDETIDQLQRLDEQILRDGLMIPNNRQIRTRVFVAKDTLRLGKDMDGKPMRDDPMMVTLALGKLQLIGNTVEYINRISVTSGPSGEVVPPPTVNPDSYEKSFDLNEGAEYTITLTGTSLKNAVLTSDDPNIEITKTSIVTTNTTLTAQMEVKDSARLGQHTLNVTNARSSVPITITVEQPLPKDISLEAVPSIAALAPEEKTYPLKIRGRFLQGADLIPSGSNNLLTTRDVKPAPDGKSLSAKLVVPPKTGVDQEYAFKITNEQHKDVSIVGLPQVKFKINSKPAVPTLTTSGVGVTTAEPELNPTDVKYNPVSPKSYEVKLRGENLNNIKNVEPQPSGSSKSAFSDLSASSDGKILTMKFTLSTQDLPAGAKQDEPKIYRFKLKDTADQLTAADFAIVVKPQDKVSNISVTSAPVEMSTEATVVVSGKDLEGATLTTDSTNPANWEINAVKKPNDNASQMSVTIKALPAANFTAASPPVTLKFKVTNSNMSHDETVTITVKFKAP